MSKLQTSEVGQAPWPSVSVVMPVLNEERHLPQAVRHVLAQEYPGELEVVLAVGPGRDRTREVAAELAGADTRVRVVDNPSGRTPDALNRGIAAARHEIVVRVDGHAELNPGYIRTAVTELQRTGADNVGGIMDAQGITDLEKAVAAAMRSPLGVGNARFHVGGGAGEVDTVYLGVFRRSTLNAVGGYDSHFARAQDWELNHRIRSRGGRVWFTPALRVTYRPRGSLRALAQQYLNYGRWRRVVAARHEGTINLRYLAPPTMVLGTSAATLLGLAGRRTRFALVVPAGYAAAVSVGGLMIGKGESLRTRALLPVVLATMHWAWGIGFLTSPRRLRITDSPAAAAGLEASAARDAANLVDPSTAADPVAAKGHAL
ncbi:glycosyltransferase family 2 protein [Gephyromycinifex aptenodytis]|uniref:glycosyltransferase family 2 protein n=1 Tax=Gephyromycinifex aptenodytis TaxID=2716227 RepID=UPI001D00F863|nr:glycosyltransferase family 2 protein [Gephyromycinifex aptenodytis]